MNTKTMLAAAAATMLGIAANAAVTVTDVTARQRYPWNGLVDITCSVSGIDGETNGLNLAVLVVMPDTGRARSVSHFQIKRDGWWSDDLEVRTNGNYRLLWDASADLGPVRFTNMVMRVKFDIHDNVQLWDGGPYWATTNIGAEEPHEYGLYFWWGDTVGYRHEGGAWVASDGSSQNFQFVQDPISKQTNKNISTLQSEGWVVSKDGTYVLAPEHDAAQVQWGGGWRMPTDLELAGLDSNCDWNWTTTNGVKGYVVLGRGNYSDASIFIPAAGYGHETSLYYADSNGDYYSSASYTGGRNTSWRLTFDAGNHDIGSGSRYHGRSIRPVQEFAAAAIAGDSPPFMLDTMEGTRIATNGAPETITYSPRWNGSASCSVSADGSRLLSDATEEGALFWTPSGAGRHVLTHTAGDETLTAAFTVLGDDVVLHGGLLASGETWAADNTHLVTDVVTVPNGVSLTIEPGAVVKFMDGAGIVCETGGRCVADGVIFTHVNDDTVGGDTLFDGAIAPIADKYALDGVVGDKDTEYRHFAGTPLILLEDFERDEMCFALSTVGNFPNKPGVQDGMGKDGTRGFGFGRSSCGFDAWDGYVNTLTASFGWKYHITKIEFDEMERYDNWGSQGFILVDGEQLSTPIFGKLPSNSGGADAAFRHTELALDIVATSIGLKCWDITTSSELFIDNIKIYGTPVAIHAVTWLDWDGTVLEVDENEYVDEMPSYDGRELSKPADGQYSFLFNGWSPKVSLVETNIAYQARFAMVDTLETDIRHGSEITESADWPKDKVILIDGIVTVKSGATLTISPGAVVKFMDGAGIVCEAGGRCVADGVIFTHVNDDTVGGDTLLDGSTESLADMYVLDGVSGNDATQYRYHPDPTVTLSGTIAKNEVWRGFNVYHVTGNITVSSGVTLTVEPGAIIKFDPGLSLSVYSGATLNAIGTRAQPIVFTSIRDDNYGGDTNGDGDKTMPYPADWGCVLISGGNIQASYCRFTYGSGVDGNQYGARACVFLWNGGSGTFDGCLFGGSLMDGCFAQNATFRNCIFTDCDRGLVSHTGTITAINCVATYNRIGFFSHTSPLVVRNSISSLNLESAITGDGGSRETSGCFFGDDPKFLDAENGDYRIAANSPCVDAADAEYAPETDYFGQPRVNAPDIGICEIIPRGVTSDIDLVPQSVTADTEAVSGQPLTVSWEVANMGGADVDASWRDTISLVSENGHEVELGDKVITKRLAAGGTIACSATFIVPALAEGAWYPKVNVNSSRDVFEGALGDNNAMTGGTVVRVVSAAMDFAALAAKPMALDTGKASTFRLAGNGETGSLLVIHSAGDLSAWLGVGNSVLEANAVRTAVKVADGVWLLQIPAGDDVYVSFRSKSAGVQDVSFSRETGDFRLFDLGRVTAANSGSVSLQFAGNGFDDGLECRLARGGVEIEASEVSVESPVSGIASFLVTGASAGDWNLIVRKGDEEVSVPCLTLTECRVGPKWGCRLDVLNLVRANRTYTGVFEFWNGGDMPLAAPYVKLTADEGTQIRLSEADAWTDTIELMATSETYPASQLKAGETNRVSFLYKSTGERFRISYEYAPVETDEFIHLISEIKPVRPIMPHLPIRFGDDGQDPVHGGLPKPYVPFIVTSPFESLANDEIEISGMGVYNAEDVLFRMRKILPVKPIIEPLIKQLDDFPWQTNAEYMRPTWATDEMWGHALAILKSNLGSTWHSYQQRMRNDADYLMRVGQPTRRLDWLFQLEVNEALGIDRAVQTLAGATDLARSGRGVGLSFGRTYPSAMCHRLTKGRLGYGWLDNYSVWAEMHPVVTWTFLDKISHVGHWQKEERIVDGATVEFHLPGGSSYMFERQNGVWQPKSAFDKTTLEIESSLALLRREYVLTFVNGTVMRFNRDTGRPTLIRDNQGNAMQFTYGGDQLAKVLHSDGQSLTFTYSGDKVASVADDQGRTVHYGYTGDLLTSVTAFNGLVTRYAYHAADATPLSRALERVTYPDGTTKDYTYDDQGRVATVSVNGNQFTTEIVRGACGSYAVIAPNGGVTQVLPGAKGETLKVVNALGQMVEQTYTEDTLLESVIAPSGKRNKISYDGEGKTVAALSASGAETKFSYEPDFDNLASVTDAKGHAISYGYDQLGRGNSISYVDGSSSSLEYNERGDVAKSMNRRGESIAYEYDAEGNLTKKTWPNGRTFTMAYDAKGNVTNATDSVTGAVTMEYDANERLTCIVYPKGRGFAYTYDESGRVIERTMLHGDGVSAVAHDKQRYIYDALGRLATVTDGDGNPYLTNAYDPTTGWLVTQTHGNGTVVSNAYDILGRTIGIYHGRASSPSEPPLAFFEYAYDEDGKCISQTTAEGVETYTYDADGQLTAVTYPDGTSETFTYDAVGNRLTSGGEGGSPAEMSYTVNAINQYTSLCASVSPCEQTLTYDLDGNLTSRTDVDGTTTYFYDVLNRLVAVTNEAKNIRWACEYDVFGNRVSVTDNGTTTERLFVQGELPSVAAEYQGNALTKSHVLVGAVRLATHNSPTLNSQTLYYHSDLLGSARLLTDGSGSTKCTRSFKAFGETRVSTGETTDAGYVGTLGVETDSNGLLFMRNRYYDAGMGRFMQMDPIGLNAGDVNVYRYCGNDGVSIVDPQGLFEIQVCLPVISEQGKSIGGCITVDVIGLTYSEMANRNHGNTHVLGLSAYEKNANGNYIIYVNRGDFFNPEAAYWNYQNGPLNVVKHEAAHTMLYDKYGEASRGTKIGEIIARMAGGESHADAVRASNGGSYADGPIWGSGR